jgi:tetratricopeptide (TPR) repeat protein
MGYVPEARQAAGQGVPGAELWPGTRSIAAVERDEMTMVSTPLKLLAVSIAVASQGCPLAWARDAVTITIPMRTRPTEVQRLNREGVEAVKKNQYEKAESLFYKAYLYDPGDPFTLNNLGYISELKGQMDRAQKFYALASEQGSNADINLSNVKRLEGQPMMTALGNLQDSPMRVNRMNVNAMRLLSESRGMGATVLLLEALRIDPNSPFTLNNLGVAKESTGDYGAALQYYRIVANSHSSDTVAVTPERSWSGKAVSEMAAANAVRLENQQQRVGSNVSQAAVLSMRGVLAANQNDWMTARKDFLEAYALDPSDAFALNNRAYVAEMDGDLESAQFFYEKAQQAGDSNTPVGIATQHLNEGKSLLSVAASSNNNVDGALDRYSQARRRESAPIELTPRGSAAVGTSTATPEGQSPPQSPAGAPVPSASQLPR